MAARRLEPEVVEGLIGHLRAGLGPMEVARLTGVSKSSIYRLHISLGGVYRPVSVTYSDRFLDLDERREIARLLEAGRSRRAIAVALRRSPSTISREVRRNSDLRTGRYQPDRADTRAWQRQRRPRPTVWSRRPALRAQVQAMLDDRYSPEQVTGRLRVLFGEDAGMRVSHETIYRALYVHPRGELTRELKAHLRSGRTTRRRRGRQERRGKIIDAVSIHDRPDEVAGRLIPGHHEGDLIKGSTTSNSAIGTIVERHSGYLTLLHLPEGHTAPKVAAAVITSMSNYPPWFAKTLTWDRGTEMAHHKTITDHTGIQVYFADPYTPQQRPSNENTNGLLREYFPKGSDLSIHTATDLATVADQLNDRPRKRLGYHTPREVFTKLQTTQTGDATTA